MATSLINEVVFREKCDTCCVIQVSRDKENHFLRASSGGTVSYH